MLEIWKELSTMSFPGKDCEAGVLFEEILIVGKFNENCLSDIESYNPVTDNWKKTSTR